MHYITLHLHNFEKLLLEMLKSREVYDELYDNNNIG